MSYTVDKENIQISEVNEAIRTSPKEFIECVSRDYLNSVKEIATAIASDKSKKIIMLSGPSGSGKTTTTHLLAQYLLELGVGSEIVSLDDFYLGRDKAPILPDGRRDYETIEALDIAVLKECLSSLVSKGECQMPRFDFNKGCPFPERYPMKLDEGEVVIFEGIHALNPLIVDSLPAQNLCKIYVSVKTGVYDGKTLLFTPREIRLIRRTVRDYQFRNSSPQNTFHMWTGVVMGEDKYLHPYRKTADYSINSVHAYELSVMKNTVIELLSMIKPQDENYTLAIEIIKDIQKVEQADIQLVPDYALIREFIGKRK